MFNPNYSQLEDLIESFLKNKISNYNETRNFSFTGNDTLKNVSGLSPFISRGLLKEKHLLKKVIKSKNKSEKFIQEIFWRVYWQGWLENHSSVWENYKRELIEIENNLSNVEKNYKLAISSKTKIEPFNDWVEILKSTGYLHNHVRMWFASIWIFFLGIPWQLGAKFFYQNLLDGDIASNLLSWRWVAGLQTKGKRYIASEININKYTLNRYRGLKLPNIKNIVLNYEEHTVNLINYSSVEKNYVNCALLINANYLNSDLITLLKNNIKVILFLKFTIKDLNQSKLVREFKEKIYNEYKKKNSITDVEFIDIELPQEFEKLNYILNKYAINNVVLDYLRCGYEKDIMIPILKNLRQSFKVHQILDDFYTYSWQYCKKGFFKFKEKIPLLLDRIS